MSIQEQLNEKVKALPESLAAEVLNYIAFLEDKRSSS